MRVILVMVSMMAGTAQAQDHQRHGRQLQTRDNGLHFSGDIYIDTGYEKQTNGLAGEPDTVFWLQEGRFRLRATPTWSKGNFFAQANAEILSQVNEIRGNELIDTDDAWVMFGHWDAWDLQVGRYEAWEVYHKGQGLERDTLEDLGAFDGPDIYEVNYAYYRQNGFGAAAVHYYPADWARFELSAVFGNQSGLNSIGARATGILQLDFFTLKAAAEWRQLDHQDEDKPQSEEKRGAGGSMQFSFAPDARFPVQFGINGAYGLVDIITFDDKVDERGSVNTLSLGGFANLGLWSASLGLGYNHTIQGDRQENDQTADVGHFVHSQAFFSVKHPIVLDALTAKIVAAYAKADLEPSFDNPRENEMFSVRVRLSYVWE